MYQVLSYYVCLFICALVFPVPSQQHWIFSSGWPNLTASWLFNAFSRTTETRQSRQSRHRFLLRLGEEWLSLLPQAWQNVGSKLLTATEWAMSRNVLQGSTSQTQCRVAWMCSYDKSWLVLQQLCSMWIRRKHDDSQHFPVADPSPSSSPSKIHGNHVFILTRWKMCHMNTVRSWAVFHWGALSC